MSETPRSQRALALMSELSASAAEGLSPEMTLASAGIDSLAFAELAAACERELEADLWSSRVDGSSTVGEVLRTIEGTGRPAPADPSPTLGRLQGASRAIGGPFLRSWFHLELVGADRLPARGPVIVAMNHESALDIPIAVVACPRPIRFMAKRELFKGSAIARALHELGGFVVDRDRFDAAAVRAALAVIHRGEVLGMYPEGTRSAGSLLPFLPGAAWLALSTGAPLVPVGIRGTRHGRITRRHPIRVAFGVPIEVEFVDDQEKRQIEARSLTQRLRADVEGLVAI